MKVLNNTMENARLVLPDPLWIVADDTLAELGWALRSKPLVHLALGMGLVEELRATRGVVSNWQLGRVLGLDMENFNHNHWFGKSPLTYIDIMGSNFSGYAATYSDKARELTR